MYMLPIRLKIVRKHHGHTQRQLADMLHVDVVTVSRWERGDSIPPADQVVRIAELYNISTDWLLGVRDKP